MAKPSSSRKPRPGIGSIDGGRFAPPDLMRTNPMKEQFAPTPARPIRQHARMAGDPPLGGENKANARAMEEAGESTKKYPDSLKDMSDKALHQLAAGKGGVGVGGSGNRAAKAELIRRINEPVR